MSAERTLWHLLFRRLLLERAPSGFVIQDEFPLSKEPQRIDFLVLRKTSEDEQSRPARVMSSLWSRLQDITVMEFKSCRRPFRRTDNMRLLGYAAQYIASAKPPLPDYRRLGTVLLVPERTDALYGELGEMRQHLQPLEPGYFKVLGETQFKGLVVDLSEVARAERDALLKFFAEDTMDNEDAERWLFEQAVLDGEGRMALEKAPDFKELVERLMASDRARQIVKETMTKEERLEGLSTKDRLEGLSEEELKHLAQLLKDKLH